MTEAEKKERCVDLVAKGGRGTKKGRKAMGPPTEKVLLLKGHNAEGRPGWTVRRRKNRKKSVKYVKKKRGDTINSKSVWVSWKLTLFRQRRIK